MRNQLFTPTTAAVAEDNDTWGIRVPAVVIVTSPLIQALQRVLLVEVIAVFAAVLKETTRVSLALVKELGF